MSGIYIRPMSNRLGSPEMQGKQVSTVFNMGRKSQVSVFSSYVAIILGTKRNK